MITYILKAPHFFERVSGPVKLWVWAMDDNGNRPQSVQVIWRNYTFDMLPIKSRHYRLGERSFPGLNPEYLYYIKIPTTKGFKKIKLVLTNEHNQKTVILKSAFFSDGIMRIKTNSHAPLRVQNSRLAKYFGLFGGISLVALLYGLLPFKRLKILTLVNPERFGHLLANPEIYLAELAQGLHGTKPDQIVFFVPRYSYVEDMGYVDIKDKIANPYLLNAWRRKYIVIREGIISKRMIDCVASFAPQFIAKMRPHGHRDIHNCLSRTTPSASITEEEERKGAEWLAGLGVNESMRIVCYHHRSSDYVKKLYENLDQNLDFKRYNYRNVTASNYYPAIQWLLANNFIVVRLGSDTNSFALKHQNIIDYASLPHEPWMDFYLMQRCEFYLGTTSGVYALAEFLRKPIVFTNFAPVGHVHSWNSRHLTIFKKLYNHENKSFVSFNKQLKEAAGWTIHAEKILCGKLEYIENTPEEILEVVQEMVGRLNQIWIDTEENIQLQEKFWSLIPTNQYHIVKKSHIGSMFLNRNRHWAFKKEVSTYNTNLKPYFKYIYDN